MSTSKLFRKPQRPRKPKTPPEDLTRWLTKPEAAQVLGKSEKTVERLAAQGRIRKQDRDMPGRKALPVYNPDDLLALKAEMAVAAETIAQRVEGVAAVNDLPALPIQPGGLNVGPQLRELAPLLQQFLEHAVTRGDVPITVKVFLTRREAADLSGLPAQTISDLVRTDRLHNYGTSNRIRVAREEIERLPEILRQSPNDPDTTATSSAS